jgi:hypothetical protein
LILISHASYAYPDSEPRATIQAALNRNESFRNFVRWIAFGGAGLGTEGDRLEQRKAVKYAHPVANCVTFHTVGRLRRELAQLHAERYPPDPEAVAALGLYRTPHLHRLGRHTLD